MVQVPRRRRRSPSLLQWPNQFCSGTGLIPRWRLLVLMLCALFLVQKIWWKRGDVIDADEKSLRELLLQLQKMAHTSQPSRQLSNVLVATTPTPVDDYDITLVTQTSTNKLDVLLLQIQRWKGPVSCAVYIQTSQHVEQFMAFLKKHKSSTVLQQTSLHVMMESPSFSSDYPINELRNLAMNHAVLFSDYLLVMDVDFLTDANAYTSLKTALTFNSDFRQLLHTKTAFVLPAFERFLPSQKGEPKVITMDMIPSTKQELRNAMIQKEAAPFHETFAPGHGPTNYTRWWLSFSDDNNNNTNSSDLEEPYYPISFALRFEPYVLVYRHGLPPFWPGFRGFGYNKASWFAELHYLGFQYMVLTNHFVIHKNHNYGGGVRRRRQDAKTLQEWRAFKQYILETYPHASKEVFRDYADGYGNAKWKEYMGGNITDLRPWYQRIVDP